MLSNVCCVIPSSRALLLPNSAHHIICFKICIDTDLQCAILYLGFKTTWLDYTSGTSLKNVSKVRGKPVIDNFAFLKWFLVILVTVCCFFLVGWLACFCCCSAEMFQFQFFFFKLKCSFLLACWNEIAQFVFSLCRFFTFLLLCFLVFFLSEQKSFLVGCFSGFCKNVYLREIE